jgi:hypothetical protein
MREKKDNQ